jgi:hypothetical protein
MNQGPQIDYEADIKRVGKSGQISLGKEHTGQYFREERREDGSILLVPVVVVARSHWTVRDEAKIRKALEWAAANPPRESNLDALSRRVRQPARKQRGR